MKKLVYAVFVSILVCGNNIVVDFNNETYCEDFNIVINEINYNPALDADQEDADYEFIELYNNGDESVSLHGWYLSIGSVHSCYQFGDVVIEPHSYLILARNGETYPGSVHLGSVNALDNSGDTITLRNNWYLIVDRVTYNDGQNCDEGCQQCWPTNADAGGSTLELISPDLDNSNATSWQDSFVIPGGTPGYENSNDDGLIYGCIDPEACNYNSDATNDNGSCEYSSENFDCDGNCLVESDCFGECGGTAVIDECGECGGDGIAEGECDCDGNTLDCFGECGGTAVIDECGECGGDGIAEGECPEPGFSLSLTNYSLEYNSVDVILNNESAIAGFQFDVIGFNVIGIEALSLSGLDFSVYNSDSSVIGFSLSGALIESSNSSILRLFFDDTFSSQFCIENPILSDPSGLSVETTVGDCINIAGCTDVDACNYGEYEYSCDNCCNYGEMYWLDTDGDGLGFMGEDLMFCEDPGFPWVQNHDDFYPNCFSNFVDDCGQCDGDNSSCSGCLDSAAFNFNCLNGNWPNSATFGCDDEVIVSDNSCLYPPDNFDFNQSTKQAFYKFSDGSINGQTLEYMGIWIGAFRNGECVGSWPWVGEFTTVPVMGDDGEFYSEGYMLEGEFPEFYIYDPETDEKYSSTISNNFEWLDLEIYHIDDISVSFDCNGIVNGESVIDECGVCDGDGFLENCLGNNSCQEMDCFGVCGGEDSCESQFSSNWSDYGFNVGDVNADFEIDIVDITNQVNFVLNNPTPNQYEFWASDMNSDMDLNVIDVMYLSGHILGMARSSSSYSAHLDDNKLYTSGAIGGIQFSGNLITDISQGDIVASYNNRTIIYSLDGELNTKEFIFEENPIDLIVVASDASIVSLSTVSTFKLNDAYPNPFNPSTNIDFSISVNSHVSIKVYDTNGREVASLINQQYSPGNYTVKWNADEFSSGIYLVKMISEGFIDTQKIMLIK